MPVLNSPNIDPREKQRFQFVATPFRVGLVFTLKNIFRIFMDLKIEGKGNFPQEGPVIVAANHVTNFDVFPMQLSLPRPIFYMAKSELFKNPIMDIALRNVGAFPVHRQGKDLWALKHAKKTLSHEQTLGMFPEGTRSRGEGLGLAKTGTARLAMEANVPIMPMAIIGSNKFFREFPRRNQVTVIFCPPILPQEGDDALALTDRIMFSIAANLPPEMRGVYAEMPEGFGTPL
ncbi:MAG: 1-acyl-sn-glycerol-3-phosphate acyltransferase [Anaerolineales bacterium]|uniref:1-acyl-sn-glycerol-3-phosphate acyltransferase n=1 Tax=Candidatus Desulfolinea nitratireducens TaxID=2841698 RepID=A0A8J6NP17_9CHLR|nr:1-acyl-sn-glycerol-3-phosphate acyltransferase [Candidatus Desulfolinea nitratireducens]MBL6960109.1 1-acyl-sn-glycerol-3-phosphate acyltransferase [Anaerolineales bacterium]